MHLQVPVFWLWTGLSVHNLACPLHTVMAYAIIPFLKTSGNLNKSVRKKYIIKIKSKKVYIIELSFLPSRNDSKAIILGKL